LWAECRRAGEIFFPGNIVCRRAELLPTTALLVIQRARKESGLVFAKKQSGVVFAKKQSGVAVPTPARWCGARSGVGRGWMWCGRCDPSALVWREEWGRAAGGCGVAVVNQGHHVWLLETWSCYRTAPAQWGASRVEAFACRCAELRPTTALLVIQRARKESGVVFAKKQSGVVFAKKQSGVAVDFGGSPTPPPVPPECRSLSRSLGGPGAWDPTQEGNLYVRICRCSSE